MTSEISQHLRDAARALAAAADAIERGDEAPAPRAPPPRAPAPSPAWPSRPAPAASGHAPVCKFGRCKDQPLDTLDDKSLSWYATALETSVNDPSKAQYRSKNEADLRDVRAEQDRRFVR